MLGAPDEHTVLVDYNLRTLINQAQLGHQIFKNWSQKGLVVVVVGQCEWWYSGFFIDCVCDQWLGTAFRIVFHCIVLCILCSLCVTNGCVWWFVSTFGTIQDPVTRKKLLTVIKIIVIIVANKIIIIIITRPRPRPPHHHQHQLMYYEHCSHHHISYDKILISPFHFNL